MSSCMGANMEACLPELRPPSQLGQRTRKAGFRRRAHAATFAVLAISNQPAYWFTEHGDLTRDEVAIAQAELAVRLVG